MIYLEFWIFVDFSKMSQKVSPWPWGALGGPGGPWGGPGGQLPAPSLLFPYFFLASMQEWSPDLLASSQSYLYATNQSHILESDVPGLGRKCRVEHLR